MLAVAGLKIGQIAGKEDFEAARDRLVATGVFETVGYRFAPVRQGAGYDGVISGDRGRAAVSGGVSKVWKCRRRK